MPSKATDIRTPDGTCNAYVAWPAADGPVPGVLMFMDAIGFRPAIQAMADRIAAAGYCVLLPNMFYRIHPEPLRLGAVRLLPENRPALMQMVHSLTPDVVVQDAGVFLDFLAAQPEVSPGSRVGVVGYCMGGSMAVRTAAAYPDRIGVAASFHGGRQVTDLPTSPHRLLGRISAELYFGHADQDPTMPAEHIATLEAALQAAGVRYQSELYTGARHGFTMRDLPVHDQQASERHWQRLLLLLGRLHSAKRV